MNKKQVIRISEKQLRQIVTESAKKYLNETESYGWTVETNEAEKAYDFMAGIIGEEELNAAIKRALGDEKLAEIMAYLLRMYNMQDWEEYRESNNY